MYRSLNNQHLKTSHSVVLDHEASRALEVEVVVDATARIVAVTHAHEVVVAPVQAPLEMIVDAVAPVQALLGVIVDAGAHRGIAIVIEVAVIVEARVVDEVTAEDETAVAVAVGVALDLVIATIVGAASAKHST